MTIQNDFSCFQTCLRADLSNFLCSTRKRDVCVKPSLIVFQHTQCALFDLMLIGCYRIWSNNVCGHLCKWSLSAKTNQSMCHCVQTIWNLGRGCGKLNVYEEITMYFFKIYRAWENYKSCVDFARTYENSTKTFFEATIPKPIRQGFLSKKGRTATWFNCGRVCFSWEENSLRGIVRLLFGRSWLDSFFNACEKLALSYSIKLKSKDCTIRENSTSCKLGLESYW